LNEILASGIPTLAVLIGILINDSRLSDFGSRLGDMQKHFDQRIDDLKEVMNARFDAAHGDLLRVEQVMDARLKHLEDERR